MGSFIFHQDNEPEDPVVHSPRLPKRMPGVVGTGYSRYVIELHDPNVHIARYLFREPFIFMTGFFGCQVEF